MTFTPDYKGMGELLRSEEMLAEMVRRAELVKSLAEATAPYDPGSTDGTHYRDAFRIESSRDGGAPSHRPRAEAKVTNDDAAAFYIEHGTGDTPKFRTLGKALDAASG